MEIVPKLGGEPSLRGDEILAALDDDQREVALATRGPVCVIAHKFVKGLESGTLTVSLLNDTATSNVLQTLNAAFGTTVAVKMVQAKVPAVSATNPLYTFDILVNNLTPINGAVGDIGTQDITFTLNSAVTKADTGTF